MTRNDFVNILHDNVMLECEAEDAVKFVRDLLGFLVTEIEAKEPYAVNTIKQLKIAEIEVNDLLNLVYEMEV